MPLIHHTYGKGRVRVMRVHRTAAHDEVRDCSVKAMLEGDFAESWTEGDNRRVVATDSIKNIVNLVAAEQIAAGPEVFAQAVGARLLGLYPQVTTVRVAVEETRWRRASIGGAPHPHTFVLDGNGRAFADVVTTREESSIASGILGYTFMKSTQSGWEDFVTDRYTTLPPTADRIAATAMDADWTWRSVPADYDAANALVLSAMLDVFGSTYSKGVQDSLYRMGEAALAAVPELATVRMACPNKHYIPLALDRFGAPPGALVFTATDEPHGQIECIVGR